MANFESPVERYFERKSITAVKTDVAMDVFYNGDQLFASAEVDATSGDITLKDGSASPGAGDDSVGLPTKNGVYDVSDATANTYGEVHDDINKSANWRCKLGAVRRADLTSNTMDTLLVANGIVKGADNATRKVSFLRDTTIAVQTNTFTIGVRITADDVRHLIGGGWQIHITNLIVSGATTGVGSGSGYNDGDGALDGLNVIAYSINDSLKTQRRIWYDALASGVAETYTETSVPGFGGHPLTADPGEDMLILIQNSGTGAATITSPTITVDGYMVQVGGSRTRTFRVSNV